MLKKVRLIVVIVAAILLGLLKINFASGWLLGNFTTTLLMIRRDKFYREILKKTELSKKQFSRHSLLVFLLVSLTLLIPFKWSDIFNPYTVFVAFLFDRVWLYLSSYFIKEDDSHVAK